MRKIIQIAIEPIITYDSPGEVYCTKNWMYALCDDGTIWISHEGAKDWVRVEKDPIPQGDE